MKDERIEAIAHELGGIAGIVTMWAHVVATEGHDGTQRARAAEALTEAARVQARLVEELVAQVAPAPAPERTMEPMKKKRPVASGDVEEVLATRCPWCGEPFEVLADLSAPAQTFIEDCTCCCRPIQVTFQADGGRVSEARFERA